MRRSWIQKVVNLATGSYSFLLLLAVYVCSQRLLVLGGGGAVGLATIQLAVAAGCSVSATCGSQSIERVLAFGAEQAIDYTAEVTDKYGLVIGIPAAATILLKKQLQYRYSHGIVRKLLWRKRATITMGYWWTYMRADAEGLDEIRRLSEAGKLKIPVEKTFPIAEVRKAHEVKEKRIIPGKVVLEVDCNTTPEAHLCSK
ncbi:hypothetical protein BHM03_00049507 [Ensete ventricosum]|nr:hypothetical protein BHM03_00049507 [Ensete ventricosum]